MLHDGAPVSNTAIVSFESSNFIDKFQSESESENDEGKSEVETALAAPSSPSCVSQTSSISSSTSTSSSVPKLVEESSPRVWHPVLPLQVDSKLGLPLQSSLRINCKYSPRHRGQNLNPHVALASPTPTTGRRVRGLWNPDCHCLFSGLHDDVLLFIMSHLTMNDIVNAGRVCRRWRHCASHSHSWKYVDATDFISSYKNEKKTNDNKGPSVTSQTLMKHLERHATAIESLRICDIEHRLVSDIALPSLTNLKELALTGYADLTDTHVHVMLLSSKRKWGSKQHDVALQVLKLEQCPLLTDASVRSIALFCTKLKELSVKGCRKITNIRPLQALFQYTVEAATTTTSSGKGGISFDHLFSVPTANATTTSVTAARPRSSPSNNVLHSLFAPPPSSVATAPSSPPNNTTALRSLFAPPPTPTNPMPLASPSGSQSKQCKPKEGRLTRLDISQTGVTASSLVAALQPAKNNETNNNNNNNSVRIQLESIRFNGSGESWNNALLQTMSRVMDVRKLQILDIGCSNPFQGSSQVTNDGLQSLIAVPPNNNNNNALRELTLAGHSAITAESVVNVLSCAPHLTHLDLGGCQLGATATLSNFDKLATALLQFGNGGGEKGGGGGLQRLSLWRCFSNRKQAQQKRNDGNNHNNDAFEMEETMGRSLLDAICHSSSSKTLVELDLDGCYFVTTNDVEQLVKHCVRFHNHPRHDRGLQTRGTRHSETLRKQTNAAED